MMKFIFNVGLFSYKNKNNGDQLTNSYELHILCVYYRFNNRFFY